MFPSVVSEINKIQKKLKLFKGKKQIIVDLKKAILKPLIYFQIKFKICKINSSDFNIDSKISLIMVRTLPHYIFSSNKGSLSPPQHS